MQSYVTGESRSPDYSFPWSMAEEEERGANGPVQEAGNACGVLEAPRRAPGPTETVPVAFRAWLLEHDDELKRH